MYAYPDPPIKIQNSTFNIIKMLMVINAMPYTYLTNCM